MSRVLVTGGAGFIGSNLADSLATAGHEIVVYDALLRPGVERNLEWLRRRHGSRIIPVIADIRTQPQLADATAGCAAIFHLAAQVAVTTSLSSPLEDFEINVRATVELLEAVRRRGENPAIVFASTNKVYGDLGHIPLALRGECWLPVDDHLRANGVNEASKLDFHTPYGCSKGAADQYVLDYARSFGLRACVLRMSCIYGPRQMGTEDQGWLAHFLISALRHDPLCIYGDGCQVRDVLDVSDTIKAYLAAWRLIDQVAGHAFNLGGGPANAVSLRQLISFMELTLGRPVNIAYSDWRAGDQRYFVANASAARQALGLPAPRPWRQGVAALAEWLQAEHAGQRVTVHA